MVNPGVDGYTVVKPQINGKSPKNAKRQPTENQKNSKTEIKANWGPGLHLAGQRSQIAPHPSRKLLHCNKHFKY